MAESRAVPIHKKTEYCFDYTRLDMLWDRYPKYHEKTCFANLEQQLCEENHVRLVEWPYDLAPSEKHVREYVKHDR